MKLTMKRNKKGFTLLEIIIVIIIVGVLASLALPRFFSTVEYSRSTEALSSVSAVRQSMERCYLQRNGTYAGCTDFTTLDLNDPGTSPNAHFTYTISGLSATGYTLTATRNTRDGGTTADIIAVAQTATGVTRSGVGAFKGIQ